MRGKIVTIPCAVREGISSWEEMRESFPHLYAKYCGLNPQISKTTSTENSLSVESIVPIAETIASYTGIMQQVCDTPEEEASWLSRISSIPKIEPLTETKNEKPPETKILASKPEVKPKLEVRPKPKSEPEVRPKPKILAINPEVRPKLEPEVKSEVKPEVKPEAKLNVNVVPSGVKLERALEVPPKKRPQLPQMMRPTPAVKRAPLAEDAFQNAPEHIRKKFSS
jgi:hypothetical protein